MFSRPRRDSVEEYHADRAWPAESGSDGGPVNVALAIFIAHNAGPNGSFDALECSFDE